jgi:two-component system, OmpR family, response regulator
MSRKSKINIFLVDDDAVFLTLLAIEFRQFPEFHVETYPTGELCLAQLSKGPDLIILDYHLDGIDKSAMDGLAALDAIKSFDANIPVIMLSAQDQIEVAINCMHHHALDYVVKSETAFLRLQKIITNYFSYQKIQKKLTWYMERM